jgi:hypothetical protein
LTNLDRSKEKKTLIQSKNTIASNSSVQGVDEWHNTEVDGRMHSEEAKIADLVEEHQQTIEKNQNERGRVGAESRKGNGVEEGFAPSSS